MRSTSRLALSAAVLGSGLLLAAPASAQEACPYPFNPADVRCQAPGDTDGGDTDDGETGGNTGGGSTGGQTGGNTGGGSTGGETGGSTGGAGSGTVVDNSPVRTTAGGGATLPFTGGEVTLIALAGAAAVGGGVVLVAAGRKRATG